jgi:hypothetical protein
MRYTGSCLSGISYDLFPSIADRNFIISSLSKLCSAKKCDMGWDQVSWIQGMRAYEAGKWCENNRNVGSKGEKELRRGEAIPCCSSQSVLRIATESQYVEQIDYYSKEWKQMQLQCIEESHTWVWARTLGALWGWTDSDSCSLHWSSLVEHSQSLFPALLRTASSLCSRGLRGASLPLSSAGDLNMLSGVALLGAMPIHRWINLVHDC